MSDDPDYVRIHGLITDVVAVLDDADASYGDWLHVASHLMHAGMMAISGSATRERAMSEYFAVVARGVREGNEP